MYYVNRICVFAFVVFENVMERIYMIVMCFLLTLTLIE